MKKDTARIGTVLLMVGVAAWVPFLLLVALGREPSIYPFLAVHLLGVVGGGQLRAGARPAGTQRPRRQVWGRVLIIMGVLAWIPYFYQKELLGRELEVAPYLALHLTGVLSGLMLLLSGLARRAWTGLFSCLQSEESSA